jgi:hypothetical protein
MFLQQICLTVAACRERDALDMALSHTKAQMQLLVEADVEAIQVGAANDTASFVL